MTAVDNSSTYYVYYIFLPPQRKIFYQYIFIKKSLATPAIQHSDDHTHINNH